MGVGVKRRSSRRGRGCCVSDELGAEVCKDGLRGAMTVSKRVMDRKSKKFAGNIHRRGMVEQRAPRQGDFSTADKVKPRVSAYAVGFFVFVVIGSAFFSIFQSPVIDSSFIKEPE